MHGSFTIGTKADIKVEQVIKMQPAFCLNCFCKKVIITIIIANIFIATIIIIDIIIIIARKRSVVIEA